MVLSQYATAQDIAGGYLSPVAIPGTYIKHHHLDSSSPLITILTIKFLFPDFQFPLTNSQILNILFSCHNHFLCRLFHVTLTRKTHRGASLQAKGRDDTPSSSHQHPSVIAAAGQCPRNLSLHGRQDYS